MSGRPPRKRGQALREETEATEALSLGEPAVQSGKEPPERRASPRLPVQLECEERVGASRYFRTTSDLSTFGLATCRGYAHPLGTRLQLRLYLPDTPSQPVCLDAEVVGCDAQARSMRLAFRQPPVEAVRRIHRFLASERQRAAP